MFFNHGSNHSKGAMIFVNPKYQLEVNKCIKDINGRSIILDTNNIYAPNDISQQIIQVFSRP